jgi:hypothetical protein
MLGIEAKIVAFLMLASSAVIAAENYCHDPAIDAEWERLISRYEGDPDFTNLYRLRKELCADVDAHRLTLPEAIKHFEGERARVIEDRLRRLHELQGAPVGAG